MGIEVAIAAMAAAAAAGAGATAYGAVSANDAQKKAMQQQKKAQSAAAGTAASEQRMSQQAQAAANRKAPDIAALMASANTPGSNTMLTGPGGVNPNSLSLGKSTLLGQ
jgi:uncharacterized protein HemX